MTPRPEQEHMLADMTFDQVRTLVSELLSANRDLKELNAKLSDARTKLVQSEKLASIGQLAAGVAHEINNPIGFIFSNFGTLEMFRLLWLIGELDLADMLPDSPWHRSPTCAPDRKKVIKAILGELSAQDCRAVTVCQARLLHLLA